MDIITYKDYLDGLKTGDIDKYLTERYGDGEVRFQLYRRQPEDLSYNFHVIRDYENQLTWGQFIAIENVLVSGDRNKIFEQLPCLIIRPENEDIFSNDEQNKEKALCYSIKELPALDVLNEVARFYELRDEFLVKKYNGVFYKEKDEEDEEEKQEEKPKEDPFQRFSSQWYWYMLTRELAIDNIVITQDVSKSRIENALDTRLSLVAPEIAFKRQKGMLEEFENKKIAMKNDFS